MYQQEILEMLEYSAIAYNDIQPHNPKETLEIIDNPQTGVQCYIRSQGDLLKIAFRGTDAAKDLLYDLRFWKKTIPYNNTLSKIRVHSGFISAYKCEQIRGKIQSFITENIHRVQITGHSYGAALAILCAVDLQYNFPTRDYEVVLFGCPRVGNNAFKKSYNNRVFKTLRVENGNDIITKLPIAGIGYRHVGAKIHIGNPRTFGIACVKDHRTLSYYEKLWKI